MAEYVTVIRTPQLGPGGMASVQAHGQDIVVANVGQTYYALDAHCPVDGTDLGRSGSLDGDMLVCPNDEARFNVRTGERVDGEGALQQREIRVEGNEVRVGPPRD